VTTDGWVKLWRQLLKSQVFQNDALLKVWIWCLLKANHAPTWVAVTTGRGTSEIKLEAGQFLFGRKTAAKELKMKPGSVRDRMKKLAKMENLVIQPATHYSVVTICNWETYQPPRKTKHHPSRQPTDTQPPTNHQPTDTDKKDKNKQNEKKVKKKAVVTNGKTDSPANPSVCSVQKEKLQKALDFTEKTKGGGVAILVDAGMHPTVARTLADRYPRLRIRACCRYGLRHSNRKLAGMIRDALEQEWDLRVRPKKGT